MSIVAKQVVHMVWFKWPAVTAQQIAASATAAKNLTKIEGVLSVDFGTNFCDRSRDFNLGLYVRFASKEALDFYQPHPIHEEFKATVAQKDDVIAMDFEVDN